MVITLSAITAGLCICGCSLVYIFYIYKSNFINDTEENIGSKVSSDAVFGYYKTMPIRIICIEHLKHVSSNGVRS